MGLYSALTLFIYYLFY